MGAQPRRTEVMKIFVRALALALPFLAVASEAQAGGNNGGFQVCFNFGFNKNNGCCMGPGGQTMQVAPWYTYWPYEAYFQVPAMSAYPYWPAPMASSMQIPPGALPVMPQPTHQAVGYYSTPPSYWYGH